MDLGQRWAAVVARDDGQLRLDEAAMIIAAHIDPQVDVDEQLAHLDAVAADCERPDLDALTDLLFGRMGLSGDRRTYDHPGNSSLPAVIDRRVGIPISLSVLMIEVGRRLDIALAGVGMPGHFLVRHLGDDTLIDPFGAGRRLDPDDCRRVFTSIQGSPRGWSEDLLAPTPPAAIVTRMLANLTSSYTRREDLAGRRWVAELRAAMGPRSPNQRLVVASELAQTGAFTAAATIIEMTADRLKAGTDNDRLRAQARAIRSRLN